jgi:hypothetical protein
MVQKGVRLFDGFVQVSSENAKPIVMQARPRDHPPNEWFELHWEDWWLVELRRHIRHIKPQRLPTNKVRNYRFFFGFLSGGAPIGFSESATTSCMMDAMRMLESRGRRGFGGTGSFLVDLSMPPAYHTNQ